jgi:CarD family transcriptional regulator
MFETGEYVIRGNGGVWKITGVRMNASTNEPMEYLLSAHPDSENVITVSANGTEIVRKITDKDAMMEAIHRIPYIRTIQAPNDKARIELYEEAMSKYDEIEWIKVIKSAYLRRRQKGFKPSEASYAEKAQGYLHSEVSILFDIPVADVENFISAAASESG